MERSKIAMSAARLAIQTRKDLGISLLHPIDVIAAAEKLGIKVTFIKEGSVEGLYVKTDPPNILVTAHRSYGRTAFTIGHEVGHHVHNHAAIKILTRFDPSDLFKANSLDEMEANYFSAFFLMPNRAVRAAVQQRGWQSEAILPEQIFRLSSLFGVSYVAMIQHMRFSLNMIPGHLAEELLKLSPKVIKESLTGVACPGDLLVVDRYWLGRPVDVRTGDLIMAKDTTSIEGGVMEMQSTMGEWTIAKPVRQGCGALTVGGLALPVRVSGGRDGTRFVGQARYRYLEDPDDDR